MTHPSALTREAQAARALIEALKDIIGDDEDFAMDVIEGQTSLVEVVNALIGQEGQDKAHTQGIETYIEALMAKRDRIEARIEKRRNALLVALQTADVKSLRCPLGTVGIRPAPAKAIPTDESVIPEEFWKPRDPVLDKRALTAALKEGRTVPGASLSNGGVTISIRTT